MCHTGDMAVSDDDSTKFIREEVQVIRVGEATICDKPKSMQVVIKRLASAVSR